MSFKNSTAIFRPLLREAFRLTWERKSLWIFGIFAAFVSTGGVVDVATSGLRRITTTGNFLSELMQTCFSAYTMMGGYLRQFTPDRFSQNTFLLFFVGIFTIGLLFLAVLSQTALVHGLKAVSHEHPNVLRRRAHDHLFRVFLIDLFTKIATAVLVVITTLPVLWIYFQIRTYNFPLVFLQTVLFFPSVLIVSILSMLAVLHAIETESSVLDSFAFAWYTFKKHWVATFEFGCTLFFLTTAAYFFLLGLMILLTVPYAFIYTASLLTGSFVLFVLANVLFGLFILFIFLFLGGSVITFQYSAWYLFYKRTGHPSHVKLPIAKLLRMFRKT